MNISFLTNHFKGCRILVLHKNSEVEFERSFIIRRPTRHFCRVFFYALAKVYLWLGVSLKLRLAAFRVRLSFNSLTPGHPFFERNATRLHLFGAILMCAIATPIFHPPNYNVLFAELHLQAVILKEQINVLEFLIERGVGFKDDCYSRALLCQSGNVATQLNALSTPIDTIMNIRRLAV